ncbi:hypothetical protein E2C01_028512 [Portunus trituberculatus]|uniref:Uncharacterized protein n=1 Tax=Portunus trituberculatus TaxID=210409 RepID=A0A5B7EP85_PORTR|nr:hypothetical protein [Portunus trituberculatus]
MRRTLRHKTWATEGVSRGAVRGRWSLRSLGMCIKSTGSPKVTCPRRLIPFCALGRGLDEDRGEGQQ